MKIVTKNHISIHNIPYTFSIKCIDDNQVKFVEILTNLIKQYTIKRTNFT